MDDAARMFCEAFDLKLTPEKFVERLGFPWDFYGKMVIFHWKIVMFHGKMVIFHGKIVIFHGKMVIFYGKTIGKPCESGDLRRISPWNMAMFVGKKRGKLIGKVGKS